MTHISTSFDDIGANAADNIPEGFRPVKFGGLFIAHNGPLYAR